jgi:hypothetical protein
MVHFGIVHVLGPDKSIVQRGVKFFEGILEKETRVGAVELGGAVDEEFWDETRLNLCKKTLKVFVMGAMLMLFGRYWHSLPEERFLG